MDEIGDLDAMEITTRLNGEVCKTHLGFARSMDLPRFWNTVPPLWSLSPVTCW